MMQSDCNRCVKRERCSYAHKNEKRCAYCYNVIRKDRCGASVAIRISEYTCSITNNDVTNYSVECFWGVNEKIHKTCDKLNCIEFDGGWLGVKPMGTYYWKNKQGYLGRTFDASSDIEAKAIAKSDVDFLIANGVITGQNIDIEIKRIITEERYVC